MLQLSVSQMKINENGVCDYQWPVSQNELYALRDACLEYSRDFILNHYKHDFKNTRLLHITYIEIIRELILILRSDVLNRRVKNIGEHTYPYLTALQNNGDLDALVMQRLKYAAKTVPSPSNLIKTLRPLKLALGHSTYKRKTISSINSNDIVTFSSSPFMERHAQKIRKETGQRVTLCSLWEWYDLKETDIKCFDAESFQLNIVLEDYIEGLRATIIAQDYEVSDPVHRALQIFSGMINHYAQIYRDHLLAPKNQKKLPKTLWFGSNNPIHPRVLRAVTQENGGHTVAHDHGRSIVAGVSHGELGTVFDFCDEFVTYSKWLHDHSDTIKNDILKYTPSEKAVQFTAFPGLFIRPQDAQNYQKRIHPVTDNTQTKTAMIITGVFMGEGIAGLNILPADITLFDFQLQLISFLKSQGYKVIIKTHPENKFPLPQALYEMENVEIVGGYVEDKLGDVDLICLDFLSSAFKSIALSNKPMLFFDFGWADIPDSVRSELETRIAIIPGSYDKKNRSYIDWNEFSSAIQKSQSRARENTDLFLQRFYGMVDA